MTYEKVVSKITNSYARQAVIVTILVVYIYKFEQWHVVASSTNNKKRLIKTRTHTYLFLLGL